jgi:hypothetical protein
MSSKKRTLPDFSEFENTETDKEKDSVKGNTNNDQLDVTVKSNTNTEQSNETLKSSTDNKKETASEFSNTGNNFLNEFKKAKKPTVEETHTRQTYLIKNELIAELEKLAAGKDRGFKTHLVNYAIEQAIKQINSNIEH